MLDPISSVRQPANAVGGPAEDEAADDAASKKQRQHLRPARGAVTEVSAVGDQMHLGHGHREQQHTPATINMFCNACGDSPNGRLRLVVSRVFVNFGLGSAGARRRSVSTSGSMVATQRMEMPEKVCRHPFVSMKCCTTGGP